MPYIFYLDGIALPVTPDKMNITLKNKNTVSTLLNGEEVSILKSPGLREISFEAFLPYYKYPFAYYTDGLLPINYYLNKFIALKNEKKPFYFLASRTDYKGNYIHDTNIQVSLEDFTILESADNGLDVKVLIRLKEYKTYSLKEYANALNTAVSTPKREVKETPKSYTVKKGDCLYNICKLLLGDSSKCWEIAKKNNIKNPNLIYPGQVIYLG